MPAQAIRQAVLLLAFLISAAGMGVTLLRGGDLLHATVTALWILPLAAVIVFQVFRLCFLVLSRTIREKQESDQVGAPDRSEG